MLTEEFLQTCKLVQPPAFGWWVKQVSSHQHPQRAPWFDYLQALVPSVRTAHDDIPPYPPCVTA